MSSSSVEPWVSTRLADVNGSGHGEADPEGEWTVIAPERSWGFPSLPDVWRYRELLYFLAWRDFKVRYKQTALGAAWVVIQPVATTVIFAVVFGHFAKIPSDGIPYPIFAFAALVPWTYFSSSVSRSANSLVGDADLISKVYFPRLIVPVASCLPGLVDIVMPLVLLVVMMVVYGVAPSPALLTLPLFVLLAFAATLGISLWLSALNVRYRDVRYTLPFLMQVWMYATPIAYPASLIHGKFHLLLALNPMTGVVEGFRWAAFGGTNPDGFSIFLSAAIAVLALAGGLVYFKRTERTFADII
jgi:lipopolysaccharide transport system permease protein